VIYGTPEDISRQIELIEQAGIQYLIVDLEPSRELEALDIFANKVIKTNVLGADLFRLQSSGDNDEAMLN
jgi:hypothetical protein